MGNVRTIAMPTWPPACGLPFVTWLEIAVEEEMKEDEGTRQVLLVLSCIGMIRCVAGVV